MRYEDENIWLTQKMMVVLYDVSVAAINQHIKNIFDDHELEAGATIKKYLIVQTESDYDRFIAGLKKLEEKNDSQKEISWTVT